jgi:hypothetical protein
VRLSLRSLVVDLEIRAHNALKALESAPTLDGRSADAAANITHTAGEARRLLGEDLDGDSETFYPTYRKLTQSLFERETFELPFLIYHDEPATRATRLCSELLENINWPYDPLLVSTFSTQYYSTLPHWRVIALPSGEQNRLLGIPDLCHELGHTVYARDDERLAGNFLKELRKHLREAMPTTAPPNDLDPDDYFTDVIFAWQEGWLQEFVCDLIATYLVGPAFPRQHARLRAMTQPPSPMFELKLLAWHPADDARMQACLLLLDDAGFTDQSDVLRALWGEMATASGDGKPDLYEVVYPPELLGHLVQTVVTACRDLGLRAYDPDLDPESDIPRLTNEAWDRLQSSPHDYAAWEQQTLKNLWSRWDV